MKKRLRLLSATMAVLCMFTFTNVIALAATKTGIISVSAVDDDTAKTKVTGLTMTVFDPAGNDVTSTVTKDTSVSGVYTVKDLTETGTYSIRLAESTTGAAVTIPVSLTTLAETPTAKTGSAVFLTKTTMDSTKSGVLSGVALNSSKAALANVTVYVYDSKNTVWETKTDSNGVYRFYLPTGTYTVVVTGSSASYKNQYSKVTVAKSQSSGPLDDLSAQTSWTNNAATAGYTLTTLTTTSKKIEGIANKNSIVNAYSVVSGTYKFLGTAKVIATGTDATGKFTITLKDYLPGGTKIALKVVDLALNSYEDATYKTSGLAMRTMTLTATTPSATSCTIDKDVVIGYKDGDSVTTTAAVMLTTLTANITTVTAIGVTTGSSITLVKGTDYTATAGKITIKKGILNVAQDYTVTVKATGYNDATVTQKVEKSSTAAPALSSTFTLVPGSVSGSTKISAIGTAAASGHAYVYDVAKTTTSLQKLGNPVVTPSAVAIVGTQITGVDVTTNKYLNIYDIKTADNTITAAKQITLTASNIKVPALVGAYVDGTALKLVSDTTLNGTTAPGATAFVVQATNGTTTTYASKTVSSTALSGKVVTLTLSAAITTPQAVNVKYTKPGTNALADANGNAMASISTAKAVTNVTVATTSDTTKPTLSSVGTTVTVGSTLAATSNEAGTLYLVPKATTVSSLANLLTVIYAGTGTAVNCAAATAGAIPTDGLATGTYVVYAVDYSGNFSTVSADVTVN